jgi:hypothetical protein
MTGRRSTTRIRFLFPIAACVATLVGAACTTTDSSPTAPTTSSPAPSSPAPTPPAPAPPPAASGGSVQITINPNPVPYSTTPIAGCAATAKSTWFYDQMLRETSGVTVTFTSRIDKFDGRVVNQPTGLNLKVNANNSLTVPTKWCSSAAVSHTAQTTFIGTDAKGNAITVDGPVANLRSP